MLRHKIMTHNLIILSAKLTKSLDNKDFDMEN